MKKKLLSIVLSCSMLVSSALTYTAYAESNTSNASNTESQAVQKGTGDQTLKGFINAEPTTLDSAKAADNYAITVIAAIFEPLVIIKDGGDGKIAYEGGAAEKWEISEDGKTYTFHLRENKWSDGQPVTAKDYEYGIKRAINPETGSPYAYLLEPILNAKKATAKQAKMEEVGVKAIDDKTLEIKLEAPTPYFLGLAGNSTMMPVRQDMVEKFGEKYGSEAANLVTNGSHKITEWVHNSKITLEKNENYWNAENVNFTKVTLPILTDVNTLMSSMLNKEVDSVSTNLNEWADKFKANDQIEHRRINNPNTFFMTFNTKDKLFSNTKVRKAFSMAIDREELNETIFDGNNVPATGWVPSSTFVGEKEYRTEAGDMLGEVKATVEDPKALLGEGLTELGMDPNPEALTVKIALGSTDQWFKTYGEYLQQSLQEKLGITLQVEQMEWTVFQDKVMKGDYQLGYMAWGSELVEPYAMLALNTTTSNALGTGWSNAEYDKLVESASKEMDEAKRIDLYKQAEKILLDESPVAPVVFSVSNNFTYKYVKNLDYNPFANISYRAGMIDGRN